MRRELRLRDLLQSLTDSKIDFLVHRNVFALTRFGQIDVIQHLDGLAEFDQLARKAERFDVDGLVLRVIDRATLIERKRQRGTPQDLVDIAALEG